MPLFQRLRGAPFSPVPINVNIGHYNDLVDALNQASETIERQQGLIAGYATAVESLEDEYALLKGFVDAKAAEERAYGARYRLTAEPEVPFTPIHVEWRGSSAGFAENATAITAEIASEVSRHAREGMRRLTLAPEAIETTESGQNPPDIDPPGDPK